LDIRIPAVAMGVAALDAVPGIIAPSGSMKKKQKAPPLPYGGASGIIPPCAPST
jgi:hypothetical protein